MKLTKRVVDAMTYDGDGTSRDVRWDDEVPGCKAPGLREVVRRAPHRSAVHWRVGRVK